MTKGAGRGIIRAGKLLAALAFINVIMFSSPIMGQSAIPISTFFGQWAGSGVSQSEGSIVFRYTQRDLNVTIRGAGEGISVKWTTIQRQKGDPEDPTPIRKITEVIFLPTERPNLWRTMHEHYPLSGTAYAWASVRGQTLTINSMKIVEDGSYEMQIYNRTLSGLGMTLEFTRLINGVVKRTVRGQLIKKAN